MEALGLDPKFVLVQAVGFAILLFVLYKFAFGPIGRTLQSRQDKITGDLDEAQSRRDEMVRLQNEYQTRLNQIEEEARDKIQGAIKEAQAARDEIITRAQAESQAIIVRGQEEIASERAKSLTESRNQIVDLATLMAAKATRENLSASGQSKIVDDAIAGIGRLN